jgi:hypothetical protein
MGEAMKGEDNFRLVAYDPAEKMTLWRHLPTGSIRWVPDYKENRDGLEKAFGPILKLVVCK